MPSSEAPTLSKGEASRMRDFQAQDDLRTLTQADEIRSDASRVKHLGRHIKKQQRALSKTGKALGGIRQRKR